MELNPLLQDIKQRKLKPIYFLMGEEPYYIDKISEYLSDTILTEDEKAFNQTILYGKDVSLDEVLSTAKRFPMMAEYQVVLVKEAQDLSREILAQSDKKKNQLEAYAENPQATTILIFCYKYKKLDKRKRVYKAIAKSGVIFESKKIYENQIPTWIKDEVKRRGYNISPKAAHLLTEFLGNDLAKITNEIDKLELILAGRNEITPEIIEENIGISKDFNNFELQKAFGVKDYPKAYRIIEYFAQNQKNHPIVLTIPILYNFFSKVLLYHGLKDKSKGSVAKALKVNPYFVADYSTAANHYPMREVSGIVATLREIDMKSKGINSVSATPIDLYKELLFKIRS